MNKYQIMQLGTISVLDDMRTISSLFSQGDEDAAWFSLKLLSHKIVHLWEFDIVSLDQMIEVKRIVKRWAEVNYSKGYLI